MIRRNNTLPRPFIKWAGGKTQLVADLIKHMPAFFNNYHEPFLGGGALFFKLYRERKIKNTYLSDINRELVNTYIALRDEVEKVIRILSSFEYNENFYYELRSKNPDKLSKAKCAARMIYLNKTGYNGLYRVNKKGLFNVPFGRYKSPLFCDKENLRAVSKALQGVTIICSPYENVINNANRGDLVYLDPPYAPVSKTANFTSYQSTGFSEEDQRKLKEVCIQLTKMDVSLILSNSAVNIIKNLYTTPPFFKNEVLANRAINCNGAKRGKIKEMMITNYPLDRCMQLRVLEKRTAFSF